MKILIGNKHLKAVGGSETFTYTLIEELQRQGHEVNYFTIQPGEISDRIERDLNVPFATGLNYDLIITGQKDTVTAIREKHFTGPLIQICHGALTPGEQPNPEADGFIAISEEVQKHLASKGIDAPVILNGINCNRFKPKRKPRKNLKVIASLVQTDEAHEMVKAAAYQLGIEVIRLNKYQDKIWNTEKEINKADLVVSLGRGCFEAMACGRPVVIFDKRKYQDQLADGYLVPDTFEDFVKNNCSGRYLRFKFTVDDLVAEIEKYNPDHGDELRDIALNGLNIVHQAQKILEACQPYIDTYNYPGKIDVIYILGKGSQWGDNEIRFSIRSFKKHFKDLRNIVIVGECPIFLKGVVHISCLDRQNVNKDARMAEKIKAACKDPRVSDDFVLCTDDTVILQDLVFTDFKGWHEGRIMYDKEQDQKDHMSAVRDPKMDPPGSWFDFIYNTGYELQKRGLPDNNYDRAHSPQPVNKAEFLQIMSQWDMINKQYTVSNIYNNSTKIFPGENIKGRNLKVYNQVSIQKLNELTENRVCMNYSDPSLDSDLKEWLLKNFPEPTEYEFFITDYRKRVAVQNWFESGCDYDEGIQIFKYFAPKNVRLQRFFEQKKGNELVNKKLKNTLRLWLR